MHRRSSNVHSRMASRSNCWWFTGMQIEIRIIYDLGLHSFNIRLCSSSATWYFGEKTTVKMNFMREPYSRAPCAAVIIASAIRTHKMNGETHRNVCYHRDQIEYFAYKFDACLVTATHIQAHACRRSIARRLRRRRPAEKDTSKQKTTTKSLICIANVFVHFTDFMMAISQPYRWWRRHPTYLHFFVSSHSIERIWLLLFGMKVNILRLMRPNW